jgi:hypothetical protein
LIWNEGFWTRVLSGSHRNRSWSAKKIPTERVRARVGVSCLLFTSIFLMLFLHIITLYILFLVFFHRVFMHSSLLEATIAAELAPILLRVTSTAWQRAHLWLGIYHLLPHLFRTLANCNALGKVIRYGIIAWHNITNFRYHIITMPNAAYTLKRRLQQHSPSSTAF